MGRTAVGAWRGGGAELGGLGEGAARDLGAASGVSRGEARREAGEKA